MFFQGTKDLQLSSHQGIVVLLFNTTDSLTCMALLMHAMLDTTLF